LLHETGLVKNWLLVLGLLATAGAAFAEGPRAIEAPPPPPQLQSGEALEPEVTIRRTQREVIYEYRQNGRLVLVRVQPRVGPPYHFIDTNGDGALEYRPGEPVRNNINQWVLWRW
jgi:uncharacterized protein (DUF58 family)